MTALFKIIRRYCGSKMSTLKGPMCFHKWSKVSGKMAIPCREETCPAYVEWIRGS